MVKGQKIIYKLVGDDFKQIDPETNLPKKRIMDDIDIIPDWVFDMVKEGYEVFVENPKDGKLIQVLDFT